MAKTPKWKAEFEQRAAEKEARLAAMTPAQRARAKARDEKRSDAFSQFLRKTMNDAVGQYNANANTGEPCELPTRKITARSFTAKITEADRIRAQSLGVQL